MDLFGLVRAAGALPRPANPARAGLWIERFTEAAGRSADAELAAFAEALGRHPEGRQLLESVFGNSPFLGQCATAEPAFFRSILTQGPEVALAEVLAGLAAAGRRPLDEAALARLLRVAKRRVALVAAVADIAGLWPLERVTAALSDFADGALGCAAAHALREAARAGAFHLADSDDPEPGSGLLILGLGKLGARELNYSSDIDLIVLYDHEVVRTDRPQELQRSFVRLTRRLARLLDERTADGYVFRTDLRLRPDPGATPIALSALAAEIYYESLGQNWERAAMIKARPVAGDRAAGAAFLERLKPYIWRKHLDFAAIQDIHSIKRQIDAHRGGGKIALGGHNIKLGRGGIREIEFFVQTQQLIWGGRRPRVRCPATEDALNALAAGGQIAGDTAAEMIAAYRYLRRVEHRLQMIDDEQTHTLPADPGALRALAIFLGYADGEGFAAELLATLRTVESHYARLFEDAPSLSAPGRMTGNLVFTGADPDPDTIATIARLGYRNPDAVDRAIRGWHHGRIRAMRSTRARELLTELAPALLTALAKTAFPDDAFMRFDRFLAVLPGGVQVFSMFYANPHLIDLVAEIVGGAPRLAEHLSRQPAVLDGVLSGDFFEPPPPVEALQTELDRLLAEAANVEDVLDISRRWANDRKFQVGVQSLGHRITPQAAGMALSNIADAALAGLLPRVEDEFARQHGRVAGSAIVVVALGKLGGREMTAASDLDLIFVYATPAGVELSDGRRGLPPPHYFARLSQRLIAAVTVQTAEGRLYAVDMRLRPSGQAGPIASSLEAFIQYHRDAAWTWESMALTRARAVAGPEALRRAVELVIGEILTRERDPDELLLAVAEMRARMEAGHHADLVWEVKYLRGGLIDVEFIAQYLQLRHAHDHPQILSPNTRTALRRLGDAGLLGAAVADELIEAAELWQGIQAMLRLTVEGHFGKEGEAEVPAGLQDTLARVGGAVDFPALKEKMAAVAGRTYRHFVDLIEAPAAALRRKRGPAPPGRGRA